MAVRRNYRINLRNYGNPPAIMVSQYDENYDLVFEVYDGVVPATGLNAYTVKLVGRQPGDDPALKYEFTGTVSGIANNILSFTIDTTMTGRAGKGTAEIVILDTTNDVKFASFNLPVYVEKAAVPDDAIDADVERAQEIADEVQDIVDTAAATVKGEAESWAVGERDGEPVPSTDPTYHNNAKYYAEQAQDIADSIGIDATLSISGKAADAKKTGDEISSLKEDLNVEIARFDKYDKDGAIEIVGYTRGKIKTDGTMGTEVYCVTSSADYVADHPVKIAIASGYQIIVSSNGGSGTYTQTSYVKGEWYVRANTPFRITIFTDPISYGQADIDTFASKVTLKHNIPYKVDDALHGVDLNHSGLESIPGKWGYGNYNSAGTFIGYAYYAASIREPISFNRDAIIHVASGYALYLVLYDSNQTFVTAFAVNTSSCAIPSGQYFAFAITRSTVDTTERIDVHEFMSAVSMETVLNDSLHRDLNHSGLYLGWQKGVVNPSGGYESSSIRIVSDFVYVGKGSKIYLNTRGYLVAIAKYTNDKHYVSVTSYYGYARVIDITDDCYVRIIVSKSDVSTISDSEVSTIADAVVIRDAIPISALSSRLATVENLTENAVVPSYFRAKINSVINTVEEDIASMGNTGDCFFFLTDVHWNGNARTSPMLIRALKHNLNVDKIICGGDIISGASKAVSRKEMQEVVASYKNTSPFYCCYGNHDGNYAGVSSDADHFTKAEMYAMAQKQTDNLMVYGGLCYFYFDNPATKTRFICLDTGESGAISETQFTWLSATLESTPANYNIFVFAHILAQATNGWFVGMTFADLTVTASMQRVFGVVDDFNTNSDSTKVIGIMGGHVHFDCDTTTPNGVPVIFTDCDGLSTNTVGGSTKGTMTELCFDVVIANYTTQKIKCVRVGRGSDREFTY